MEQRAERRLSAVERSPDHVTHPAGRRTDRLARVERLANCQRVERLAEVTVL